MSFSTRCMTANDWAELQHFKPQEFKHPEKMGYEFMKLLEATRDLAGVPFRRSSDWRSEEYNASVGGAKDSAHKDMPCDSIDLTPINNAERFEIVNAALEMGFTRIGIYQNGSIHLDKTEGRRPGRRLWVVVDNPA